MAINFPPITITGQTYDYQGIRYTADFTVAPGFWQITTPGTFGVASSAEVDAGTDAVKYVSPTALQASKYVRENEVGGATDLDHNGITKLATLATGVSVAGNLALANPVSGGETSTLQQDTDGTIVITTSSGNVQMNAASGFQSSLCSGPSGLPTVSSVYLGGSLAILRYNSNIKLQTSSAGGTLTGTWTGNVTSDERLKENIVVRDGLTNILALNGVNWDWIAGKEVEGADRSGFTAQNWESIYPDDVIEEDGVKVIARSIDTQVFDADLVEAIKAQQKQIESLLARIEVLEAK